MNGNSKIASKPVTATDKDLRRATAITNLLVQPLGILPAAVGDPIRPVAIGFFQQVSPFLSLGVSVTALRRAIGAYVHAKRYYLACSQPDAMRHDIDGGPIEPVSDSDKAECSKVPANLPRAKEPNANACHCRRPCCSCRKQRDLIRASLLGRSRS
ncbi:ProQ/FINO family protein [Ochrobactrum pecoris]|nr:ProQ/FINO family protein [Brucella pecoris]